MRTLVLFALTLGSVVALTTDASAFGKRKKAAATAAVASPYSSCDCGSSGGSYYGGSSPAGYYPGGYQQGGYQHGGYYPQGGYPGAYPQGAYYHGSPALMPGATVPGVQIPGTGVVVPVPMPKK